MTPRWLLALLVLPLLPADPAHAACGAPADATVVRALIDAQCDCATALDRKTYVSCARAVVKAALEDGRLLPACRGDVLRCVSKSTCGRPGAVACCTQSATGRLRCSVKSGASACRPPKGGSACVSSVPSCCDACGGGGCIVPTTTTTSTTSTSSTVPAGPLCGNGVREPGEACDCGLDGARTATTSGVSPAPGRPSAAPSSTASTTAPTSTRAAALRPRRRAARSRCRRARRGRAPRPRPARRAPAR